MNNPLCRCPYRISKFNDFYQIIEQECIHCGKVFEINPFADTPLIRVPEPQD